MLPTLLAAEGVWSFLLKFQPRLDVTSSQLFLEYTASCAMTESERGVRWILDSLPLVVSPEVT